ncbi:mannose-1-phosphate guanylyltransferase/mannose-6-phosphate isomerase [Francisella philomiragia]|uniref:mannose-1-phosphate guanylyltransferase n=1 Tax=Francisella philomiragia subsp. philomiragia (strain ATCC 25017 / CCUG 19701 / FSC 153 / O\|nr:mannose-1-phosphate guanylyltransferase/mannose-6-phosphate isomerase [Francisella philomiragia]AJI47304.1 mannose-1-phosphate guanylyltransferase/mannose-6-phosphate isomerase [Francisella philomiragia]AJI48394.1 mannose-1-phosphate guanylyltransferase/mannose-6-phosphate isomerase [Francisella philomiragia]AJI57473.1 mannose-1-phosphate guanylyltransferase/mannose-6-phosphate isomerase [Francisella philomiragia]MBK2020710.1 mannose-1-phosphate guanylyltransferase/mannose-6-phosphate isomer
MVNLILCGGSGTRLWPISRKLLPKQFVKMFSDKSLFQLTVERNSSLCDSTMVVSNEGQLFLAKDQLDELGILDKSIFLEEPVGRDTAPAIALACMKLDPQEIVFVTPSDHVINVDDEYRSILVQAKKLAKEGSLVTFGITPTFANTGFGYIKSAGNFDVDSFHEKPNAATAEKFLADGSYYWNSGMFMFQAGVFLEELKKYSPEIYDACVQAYNNSDLDNSDAIKYDDMMSIPAKSIDYAVMEKSNKIKMVVADIVWNDVGSFDSLFDQLPKDDNNNTINSNHISIDSKNNLIHSEKGPKKVATIGVEDLIVVDSGDALLIAKKGSSQRVKEVVELLSDDLKNIHLTAHRPWGTYTVLEDTPGYKIKKIEVKPGKRLSLQKHYHRSEHWIVVSGTATVTKGDQEFIVRPNESVYIRMGEVHRLANNGKIPVVLIEAQVGEYTGEDDIVRLEDDFNRI